MDKLTILERLERLARKLRALGLHPVTRLVRSVFSALIGSITVQIDGLSLTGSIQHRGYLWSLREGRREAYMAQLFKAVLRPGMVVCDIGSYIGYYVLLAAQRVGNSGKVFAFEPDSYNLAYLTRNIKISRLGSIIIPAQKAVSDRTAHSLFYLNEGDRSRSSLFWWDRTVLETMVESVCLDEFFDDMAKGVDAIKMDIEGAELQALKGMECILARSPAMVMFVECNPRALQAAGADARQLIKTLRRIGFTLHIIDEAGMELRAVEISEIERVKCVNLFCQRGG